MLGVAIAERFLARVQRPAAELRQSASWSRLQVEEVKQVLGATEQRIADIARGAAQITDVPQPSGGKVTIRNGVFYTDVISRRGNRLVTEKNRPYYFGGYGHFGQAGADLPNFPALGASLIQQDGGGPNFFLSPDGTPNEGGHALTDVLQVAARNRMKIDLLLSPHYFPDWAIKQAPDLLSANPGSIRYNIDHPKAREVIRNSIQAAGRLVRNESALFSFCLSNEPTYHSSGRDPYSRPLWVEYLRRQHGSLLALNALYGTSYESFETVPVPALGMPDKVGAQRAYWDWVRFNQEHFANWHGWMNDLAKAQAPGVPTHAKIMVFFTFDRNALHFGVDPELFCEATDIAGCDAYATPTGGDEAYSWLTQEMYYDLLHSFRNQPVFNSENHLIPDGSPPTHFSPEHTRAAFWQGGLHHQSATTMWVWEEGGPGGLDGSIYFRPANIYSSGQAFLDLNRLSREVTAINQAKPRVALLYSMPSNFWEADYGATVTRLYTMLNYSGLQSTFVSERQLQAGRYADVKWIIVPRATHVNNATVQVLRAFVQRGGKLLFVGGENLAWDEFHQARTLPTELSQVAQLNLATGVNDVVTAGTLRTILAQGGLPSVEVREAATAQSAWHVEYRIVPDGKRLLIPLINFSTKTQMVQLKLSGGKSQAIDLLSGETVDLNRITLASIEPRLLQVEPKS
ncbi:MAG: beta-galactosidase, partial [Acidimicrobiales bacterium]